MRKLLYVFAIVTCALIVEGCQKELGPEEKCNFVQNRRSRRVSWHEQNLPVRMYADKSVNDLIYQATRQAMDTWNQRMGKKVFELVGRTDQLPQPDPVNADPPRDGYNGIYFIQDKRGFRPLEQARTSLHHRMDNIDEADIIINNLGYFLRDSATDEEKGKIELESLMIHELGHVLGLDHIDDEPSVMQSRLDKGEIRKTLQPVEIDSLQCEYQVLGESEELASSL